MNDDARQIAIKRLHVALDLELPVEASHAIMDVLDQLEGWCHPSLWLVAPEEEGSVKSD